jgi:hypothetical protein
MTHTKFTQRFTHRPVPHRRDPAASHDARPIKRQS